MKSSFYFFFPFLSVGGFLLSFYIPILGSVFYFFLFIPLILSFFLLSQKEFSLSFLLSLAFLILIDKRSITPYIISLLTISFPGILLIRKNFPYKKVILWNSLWSIIVVLFLLITLHQFKGFSLFSSFDTFMKNTIHAALSTYKKIGWGEAEIQQAKVSLEKLTNYFSVSLLSWIAISLISIIVIHYYIVIKVLFRLHVLKSDFPDFSSWSLPFFSVWVFVISSFILWFGRKNHLLWTIGINLITITVIFFITQGLSNLSFLLRKMKSHPFLSFLIYAFLVLQPLFLGGIFLWGLLDCWFNFRKLPIE